MTRLEIDIDTKNRSGNKLITTDLRIVRECTTPRKNAELEVRVAHIIRNEVIALLKTVATLNPSLVKELTT